MRRRGDLYRTITHEQGAWAWNTETLHQRIIEGAATDCWHWQGSKNGWSNLFGVYKNGRAQMTQANRILAREHWGRDIEEYSVYMTCGNRFCCNMQHAELVPNRRHPLYQKKSRIKHEKNHSQ